MAGWIKAILFDRPIMRAWKRNVTTVMASSERATVSMVQFA